MLPIRIICDSVSVLNAEKKYICHLSQNKGIPYGTGADTESHINNYIIEE